METDLNTGVGYDCARQNNAEDIPDFVVCNINLSRSSTLGATLPMGSGNFDKYVRFSVILALETSIVL